MNDNSPPARHWRLMLWSCIPIGFNCSVSDTVTTDRLASAGLIPFDVARKHREIEERYKACVEAWQEHYEVGVRLLRADRDMKCSVARALREAELLNLSHGKLGWGVIS